MTRRHSVLFPLLLLAFLLRIAIGAPCCWSPSVDAGTKLAGSVAMVDHAAMAMDADHAAMGHDPGADGEPASHGEHEDDPRAKSCCSACGSSLPAGPVAYSLARAVCAPAAAAPLRAFATIPLIPAYEARGPPFLA